MKNIIFLALALFAYSLQAQSRLVHTSTPCDSAFYAEITSNPQKYEWVGLDSVKHSFNYHAASFTSDDVTLFWYVQNDGKLSYFEKYINRFSILNYVSK